VEGGRLGEIVVVFGGRERVHVGRECVCCLVLCCVVWESVGGFIIEGERSCM